MDVVWGMNPASLIGLSIHDEPGHEIREKPRPLIFRMNLMSGPSWIEIPIYEVDMLYV